MKAIFFKNQKNSKSNSELVQLSNDELRGIEGGVAKLVWVTEADGTVHGVIVQN